MLLHYRLGEGLCNLPKGNDQTCSITLNSGKLPPKRVFALMLSRLYLIRKGWSPDTHASNATGYLLKKVVRLVYNF